MVNTKTKTPQKGARKPTTCKEPTQCPHEHFRYEVPDRRGIAREKHINILATPKGYRWEDVKRENGDEEKPTKKTTIHRRSCPDKYVKKPEKAYVHNFLAEIWSLLTPEIADRLKNMLMNEFSMSSKDAEEFIFKQREANIINSSTVSLYKKPRDAGEGKVVFDSVIKMRTPNNAHCDKFPKSNIGMRNTWIKDFSDLISVKMTDYVLDTMNAERTERQQEIAQNLLNRFNTLLEQKASLANPKTQTHKTMVLVADRLSLWLDKNVPMAKETAQRLKDIEEAQERKKLEEERQKRMQEEEKRRAERVDEEGPEDEEQEGEGDQGPGGPPEEPGAKASEVGATVGESEAQPGEPGAEPVQPEAQPGEAGGEPGKPGEQPGEPVAESVQPEAQPGEAGGKPGEPGEQPGEAEATTGEGGPQPGKPEAAPKTSEDDGTKPAAGEELPAGGEETQPEDVTKPASSENQPVKGEEEVSRDETTGQPEKTDEARPGESDEAETGRADETQPGSQSVDVADEEKGKEDQDQITPASPAEEAQPADQPVGKGEEEPQADVPPSSETQPEKDDLDGTQPGASDKERESKGDEGKDAEPTSAQPEPPPSADEIQPTPSEIQQKAVEEVLEEGKESELQDVTLPGDTDQKITAGDEPPSEGAVSSPEQIAVPDDSAKVVPTEPGTAPGEDDEKFYEPSDEDKIPAPKEGQPADQKANEPGVEDKERPMTQPGEESTATPPEERTTRPDKKELTAEQQRQIEVIQAVTSKIIETQVEETPRQEAIKDVLGKQLERELGDDDKAAIDQVASKVGTWIDRMVEQVENEYGDRGRRTPSGVPSEPSHRTFPPVSQKPKGSIFVVKKVDDRRGYDVDLISNTRALEKIRMARGKSPARAGVPNPESALEPADLKSWARWASAVSDMAQSWAEWIEDTVQEAQKRGEILQTDDSPERLREWDEFKGQKAQGAQQWRKAKEEVDQTANLWSQKGLKTREQKKP